MIHQKTENIAAFAKLYGYVRFFYPGDEAAKLDWNKFAVYGVQYIENAGSTAELKQKLVEIFIPVAPLLKINAENETTDDKPFIPSDTSKMSIIVYKHFGVGGINDNNSMNNIYKSVRSINNSENDSDIFKSVRQYPQPGEFFKAGLSQSLSISMPLALYKDDIGTLPHTDSLKTAGFIDIVKSAIPAEYPANDKYVRLADVVICWNIFQHFYPYFDVINVDWNTELYNALADAYNDNSEYEFLNTLKKFTAKLNDGHIHVKHTSDIHNYYFPPFIWQWIENSLVITKVFDEANGKLQSGDIVAEINDIPASEAMMNEEQYVSGATEQWKRNNYAYSGLDNTLIRLLSGEKDSQLKLKIKRNGEFITGIVKRTNMNINITDNSPNIE
jgi:hypothetical protein